MQPREDVEVVVAVGGEEDDALPPGDLEVGVVQSVTAEHSNARPSEPQPS